jgi:hypothetical protein
LDRPHLDYLNPLRRFLRFLGDPIDLILEFLGEIFEFKFEAVDGGVGIGGWIPLFGRAQGREYIRS